MTVLPADDQAWLMSEEAFTIYAPCMYQPSRKKYRALMERYCADPSVKLFVCEDHGKPVGLLVLDLSGSSAEILGIAVSEDRRRHGIGRQLILWAMASLRLNSLEARTDEDAVGFYLKCGFAAERHVIQYPDGSAVRFHCTLIGRPAGS